MTLTPEEIESLRIAIAEECGWRQRASNAWSRNGDLLLTQKLPPPYTTSLDAIQQAAMERFKTKDEQGSFLKEMLQQGVNTGKCQWQLTALDWSIAFARAAKIWRYKL